MARAFCAAPLLAACLAAAGAGCGGSDGDGATSPATYTLRFPSAEAAIAADFVEVRVYDASKQPGLCQDLVQKRLTQQALPRALVEARPTRVCDLFAGGASRALPLSYGDRAVLAVATRKDEDFLIGCAVVVASDTAFDVPVTLSLASGTVLPPDAPCSSLADHCAGRCAR